MVRRVSDADFIKAVAALFEESGWKVEYGHLNFHIMHPALDLPFVTSFHCHLRGDRVIISGNAFDLANPDLPRTVFETIKLQIPIDETEL